MAREIPESEVATMEALVKCRVVMVSIALAYQHIEQGNRTMNEPDYTHSSDAPAAGTKRTSQSTQPMSAFGGKADIARKCSHVRF